MAEIRVAHQGGDTYRVEVSDATGSSEHVVTAPAAQLRRLGGEGRAEELLEASFEFLLEREPRSAILSRFDLSTIESYFPEYPDVIGARLD